MDLKQLYQDIFLEHGKSPRNLGKCEGYSHDAKGYNPLCGDKIHVYLKLDNGKKVEGLTFEGEGCAISLASASIMTELIRGKSINDAKEIMNAFLNMIKNTSEIQSNHLDEDQKTKLMSLSGVKQFPMRVKCATLSWHTLFSAMERKKEPLNFHMIFASPAQRILCLIKALQVFSWREMVLHSGLSANITLAEFCLRQIWRNKESSPCNLLAI